MDKNPLLRKKIMSQITDMKILESKGFQWNYFFKNFYISFPVWKHNGKTTLECILILLNNENGFDIKIEVRTSNNMFYVPFYMYDKPHRDFINIINKRIISKMIELELIQNSMEKKNERKSSNRKKVSPHNRRSC